MATNGIDFSKKFVAPVPTAASAAKGDKSDKPQAQFWLNIGYPVDLVYDGPNGTVETVTRFTSLPYGLPLDTMSKLDVRKGSDEYIMARTASNDLHDAVMAAVADMEPGEARILNLQIEVRRVKEDAAVIPTDKNPFVKQIQLFAAPAAATN